MKRLLLAVLAAIAASAVFADTAATPARAATDIDYRVGAGDVLDVQVLGHTDLSRSATVQTNGSIALPLLGEVPVSSLSVAEIKTKLTNLLARDYLVSPQVEVEVKEYSSQFVTVLGEVNQPGRKPLRGRTRLLDALLDAGGFKPSASGDVAISRVEGTFPGGEKTLRIRLGGTTPTVQDQVNLEVPLRNGDLITASQKYYVTVEGEVARPGRYALEADSTVSAILSVAGGTTRYASSTAKIRRIDPQTQKVEILKADLKAIRKGKDPDVTLQANDVVIIGRRLF